MGRSSQDHTGTDLYAEQFGFDALFRLRVSRLDSTIGGPVYSRAVGIDYDGIGNLTRKSDFADLYEYGQGGAGPHAVTTVSSGGTPITSFTYDANGNLLTGDGRTISYTIGQKPATITRGGNSSSFRYSPNEVRWRQVTTDSAGNTATVFYVDKLFEYEVGTSSTGDAFVTQRHYIGDFAIHVEGTTNGSPDTDYTHLLLKDNLGSVDTILAWDGSVVERRGYDAFGAPRTGDWYYEADATAIRGMLRYGQDTTRGYTGHEHLAGVALIHMNGRAYDPNLGRFLSVDPFIQAPTNSQSMNPYSYLMNSPLAGTDPTGYLFQRAAAGSRDASTNRANHAKSTGQDSGGGGGTGSSPGKSGGGGSSGGSQGSMTASVAAGSGGSESIGNSATPDATRSHSTSWASSSLTCESSSGRGGATTAVPQSDEMNTLSEPNEALRDNIRVVDSGGTTTIYIDVTVSGTESRRVASATQAAWDGVEEVYDGRTYRTVVTMTSVDDDGDWKVRRTTPRENQEYARLTGGCAIAGANKVGSSRLAITSYAFHNPDSVPHEFGHALGLEHFSAGSGAMMTYDEQRAVTGRELSLVADAYRSEDSD